MATNVTSKFSLLTSLTLAYLISTVHMINTVVEARNMHTMTVAADHSGDGNLVDCWNAALELKSCTDEIVKFFMSRNGTAEPGVTGGIDKDCCGAIELIGKECWSVMFTSVGLTNMEGNMVREYCDFQAEKLVLSPSPSPSPAPEALALSPVEITYPGLG